MGYHPNSQNPRPSTTLSRVEPGILGAGQADLVWADAFIVVRDTKFGKSRLVPLDPSTIAALAVYAKQRDRLQPHPASPRFFVSTVGTALRHSDISRTFRKLIDATGVGAEAANRPRIHDVRHTFAVRTLIRWHRDGHDVQARLPRLATFLGHRDPISTYWYLSAVPELLSLATVRLETSEATT